ncbi:TetR-like C-terminal domain-containing protein [Streptomyces sp. NBRC 110028]|uniref:TetR-like C-terminal domain-containing protein n=1 Tax=Streptomyces sp. NBRC 110028 TaxID=1621260 RepID=UPI0006E12BB5|nr:TetR-like C-terminal domain-containing protein [Streptomyces sp. NBRC 110028]
MNARPPHGSARPGGRTARTRAAVLAAAYDELDAESFSALTLDKLARRSGVHASTIRRRWRTVEGVVLDLLAERAATLPTPDSGDFRRDLHELARFIGDFNDSLRNRNVIQGLVAAAAHDVRAEEVVRDTFAGRIEDRTPIVRRAIDRGEVPADTDAKAVIGALAAPFYYRVLILRGSIDARLVRTSAEAAYEAARAGVFRTGVDGE